MMIEYFKPSKKNKKIKQNKHAAFTLVISSFPRWMFNLNYSNKPITIININFVIIECLFSTTKKKKRTKQNKIKK